MPRRGQGPPQPRPIPHVKNVVCVSSGKGGVGKSTVSANLAVALAQTAVGQQRVGLLDLDIFGPSIPKLMGLEQMGEPELTPSGSLIPMKNHGVSCMSMGFLLPGNTSEDDGGGMVAWRGMMVMKATQQLLFDVDWRLNPQSAEDQTPLDVLVIDMPPGTGDVALSLAQLVSVDTALVVTTPQQVALLDAKKGVAMFRKTGVSVGGLVLNMSHFVSPDTGKHYSLFGPLTAVEEYAARQNLDILARVPLQPDLSTGGDTGRPTTLQPHLTHPDTGEQCTNDVRETFLQLARSLWTKLA